MKIYTVGYEGLDIDSFLSLLAENDIETVVDVREMPLSRKPGFSKKSLEAVLNLSGREYVHMVALGCRNRCVTGIARTATGSATPRAS